MAPGRPPGRRRRRARVGGGAVSLIAPVPDEGLGNTSWLIDLGDGRVAVVDPGRYPGPLLADAERRGASVAFSVNAPARGLREPADPGHDPGPARRRDLGG